MGRQMAAALEVRLQRADVETRFALLLQTIMLDDGIRPADQFGHRVAEIAPPSKPNITLDNLRLTAGTEQNQRARVRHDGPIRRGGNEDQVDRLNGRQPAANKHHRAIFEKCGIEGHKRLAADHCAYAAKLRRRQCRHLP